MLATMALLSTDSVEHTQLSLGETVASDSQVVNLCDVNLSSLLDGEESTCSPFSETLDLTNGGGSIFSDDPNYLWYVKQQAELMRKPESGTRGNRRRYGSDDGSDLSSTCVMVNIKHDTCFNLCDNPSDMWHGLKMSDGMPVVIRSKRKPTQPLNIMTPKLPGPVKRGRESINPSGAAAMNPNSTDNGIQRSNPRKGRIGPINYNGGFLSLHKYVGRGNGASHIYRLNTVDPETVHPCHRRKLRGRQRIHQVQQHLAEARGLSF